MLSYPIPEAEALLESRLRTAQSSLANCEDDLDFLREQITVSTMSMKNSHSRWLITNDLTDNGGRYGKSLQLGRYAAEKRKG